jgi:hypothetical protein
MGRRRKQDSLPFQVNDLERRLSLTYAVLEELGESLALQAEGRDRIGELYRQARSQLQPIALEVEAMAKTFWFGNAHVKADPDVVLRGTLVSIFMGAQIVAIDLTLDAMALVGTVDTPDQAFFWATIDKCTSVAGTHQSMVESAMRADLEGLTAMRQLFRDDSDGASAAFNRLVDEFKQVKQRVLAEPIGSRD